MKQFADSGFVRIADTGAHDADCYGFTPMNGDATITSITYPTMRAGREYVGDTGVNADTFKEGVFYPIPFVSITLASGVIYGWREE